MAVLPFLSTRGVLGLNARNLLYVKPFNPRSVTAFADDKLRTKLFLATRGIPVPKVYATISSRDELRAFDFSKLPDECVLKPNYGYGGEGIRILRGKKKGMFLEKGKHPVTRQNLFEHIEDILDGKFSVNGRNDTAFFEELLIPHSCFARFRPAGLPDLRIVVFNLVPIMAMLRIPTAESGGKANMHLGGIGIGIDLAKGATTFAAQRNKTIQALPHGGEFAGMKIPFWDDILLACSRIQQVTNIGYLAVDMTIDEEGGPKLLEVNARAGLSVQIANLAPLRSRLERVAGLSVPTPEKGVLLGKELFGQTSAPRASQVDMPTLGLTETITIPDEDENIEIACHIHAKHERTAFAPDLVDELLERGVLEPENETEGTYRVRFLLGGKKIQTIIVSKHIDSPVRVSLGRRDLKGFLIDPNRREPRSIAGPRTKIKADLHSADRQLAELHREIPLLKALRPLEASTHLARLRTDCAYEPHFSYAPTELDFPETRERVRAVRTDDTPLGTLLGKKKRELLLRLDLLESRGNNDAFTHFSTDLYGVPTPDLIGEAERALRHRDACDLPPREKDLLSAQKVQKRFAAVLERYGLHDWEVRIKAQLSADCAVGGRSVFLREDAMFEPVHVDALIAHEIEAHVLTSENAGHQPYQLLQVGCAGYLDTQEGLAVYLQNRVLPDSHDKRYWAPRGTLGVEYALHHGFRETREYLEELGFSPEKALRKAWTLKRGMGDTAQPGAFTKDVAYFRGYRDIAAFADSGGDLRRLYVGRLALNDLPVIESLPGIVPPILLPDFLRPKERKKNERKK